MRNKRLDDLLVLNVVGSVGKSLNKPLNKYEIERYAKKVRGRSDGRDFAQPVTHRGIREAIERLEERGQLRPEAAGPGRAPHTKSMCYRLTVLGEEALRTGFTSTTEPVLDLERAREILEARASREWSPLVDRAYCEMLIAYAWLVHRLASLLQAVHQAESGRRAEQHAETISSIFTADLKRVMRVFYRRRDLKVGDLPLFIYVSISGIDENTLDEQSMKWLKEYAPHVVQNYAEWLPDTEIALTYLFSKNERKALRDLQREKAKLDRK
jgi:hypothetical protein